MGKNEAEWPMKAQIRNTEFLAVKQTGCLFWFLPVWVFQWEILQQESRSGASQAPQFEIKY